MQLSNPTISATQSGDRWTLTASVTEHFTRDEINANFQFADFVTFWEWDTSDHDFLTNTRTDVFRPNSLTHRFTWTWSDIPGDTLDTELGGEEIRAQFHLRNATTSSGEVTVFSPILQISPG